MMAVQHKRADKRSSAGAERSRPHAVQSVAANTVLQRTPSCACGGTCPRCQAKRAQLRAKDFSHGGHADARADKASERSSPGGEFVAPSLAIQRKLAIGRSDDPAEAEADRIADQVMRMAEPGPIGSTPSQLSRKCAACEKEDDSAKLRTKRDGGGGTLNGSDVPPIVHDVLRSPGQPLDAATRAFMEPRFGRDFGNVRIHSDTRAAESARAVGALAYTVGQDIVFAVGQVAPGTTPNKLLAHELTHVLQQTARPTQQAGVGSGIESARMNGAPLLQAQFETPPRRPPPPDFECRIDLLAAIRVARGDKQAALKVLVCCVGDLPVVGGGCTDKLETLACKLLPDLCEKMKQEKKGKCPVGFKPAQSPNLAGKCCPKHKGVELVSECCAPSQMVTNAGIASCCPPPLAPNDGRTHCIRPPLKPCPTDRPVPLFKQGVFLPAFACECLPESRQNLIDSVCCPVGQEGSSGTCVPEGKQPEPPPPAPPPFTVIETFDIGFEKDAPQVWFDPRASFRVSVTPEGKAAFGDLVARLEAHPEERGQLEGRASSDKPADDPDYNRRLTDRRVRVIADELKKKKLDVATRVADPPGQAAVLGCDPIAAGQWSCGDAGATEPPDKKDRKVVARVFSVLE